MQEITIIVLTVTIIDVWVNEFLMPKIIEGTWLGKQLDWKPINCNKCLSFWYGVLFSIVFMNPIYMSIYLITRFLK